MKRDPLALPILLLLLTVLVPSARVMSMMRKAVRNERAATNQRLREQLQQTAEQVKSGWSREYLKLSGRVNDTQPAFSFARIVADESVDSVVLCGQRGDVLYPEMASSVELSECEKDQRWQEANRLEFAEGEFLKAAELYDELIADYVLRLGQFNTSLAPLISKARCFEKAGDQEQAVEVLEGVAGYAATGVGKSHQRASFLRLLEIAEKDSLEWKEAAIRLKDQLQKYEKNPIRSRERNFLTKRYLDLTGESNGFPTYDSERLAIQYVGQLTDRNVKPPLGLRPTKLSDVWQHYEKGNKLATLYWTETVRKSMLGFSEDIRLPEGVALKIAPPDEAADYLVDVPLGAALGDWRLGIVATSGDRFNDSSNQHNSGYYWIGALTVAATCVSGWLLLTTLRQRMRLAQLKNDLVATVSHELKTPLASIRLLVDTLLQNEGNPADTKDQNRTTEYLQLISVENARLTRLVDNFLTFSRMERGQHPFEFSVVESDSLVEKSVSVFLDHCPEAKEFVTVDIQQTAKVSCDQDSMVTVIVNLLENAWKYGGEEKQINLEANANGDHVEIKVSDNGIGLSAGEIERVFGRFYQVDQRVARTQGGCGLGLSIVRSIVEAHGGKVAVTSKPKVGSTFVIQLPRSE